MDGIVFVKQGDYEVTGREFSDGNYSHLVISKNNIEVIDDIMPKGTVGFLTPSISKSATEVFYIKQGKIIIRDWGEDRTMSAGDLYYLDGLDRNVLFYVLEDTSVLYFNNSPVFQQDEEKTNMLSKTLDQLQEFDGDTLAHCERVKVLCMAIAYFLHFDQALLDKLFLAARFHDVGKCKIPLEILLKPDRLTNEEFEVMKQHSQYTYEMILEQYGEEIATFAFDHHERLDGKGYPRRLSGDEISMPARIICVADAYDAMVTTRPYRTGLKPAVALAELRRNEGTQFDSSVVDALAQHLEEQMTDEEDCTFFFG